MSLKEALLFEFDQEMAVTRKVLERVSPDHLAWQPHERSMSLALLATHVAEITSWAPSILTEPEFNLSADYTPSTGVSVDEILARFDARAAETRALLVPRTDAELSTTWTFKWNGAAIFSLPRSAAWRSLVMNHMIHHRGQLSVYLRQTGSRVPAIYGPSGDEQV